MTDKGECAAERHDTHDAYVNYRCRCPLARRAAMRYQKRLLLRKMHGEQPIQPNVGTARRLQALLAVGWSTKQLGELLGCSGGQVGQWIRSERVYSSTVEKVAAMYAEVSHLPPPHYRLRTVRLAEKFGWPPPAAWDDDTIDDPNAVPSVDAVTDDLWVDDVAVQLAVEGRAPRVLTPPELVAAVRILAVRGVGGREIGELLGVVYRRVERVKQRHGIHTTADAVERRQVLRGA